MRLVMPRSSAEALAQVQLLLDFPPGLKKMDAWHATIQSLVGFTNEDGARPAGPSQWQPTAPIREAGGRTVGGAAMVQSPPRQVRQSQWVDTQDDMSMASSHP